MQYVIIIDVGTGGLHVSLMDSEGTVSASTYRELIYDSDEAHKALTVDPDQEFENTLRLIEQILAQTNLDRQQVLSISVTSQRHGGVFLDANDQALYACPNMDDMAGQEARTLSPAEAQRVYELTARWPTGLFQAVRLRWFKKHKPELFARIASFLMINEWFAFQLTGNVRSEWTNAAETMLFDVKNLRWSEELTALFEAEQLALPQVLEPGTITGTLKPEFAQRLKLGQETTVVLAAADTQSALIGTGALQNGDVTVVNGSTTPIQMVVDNLLIDPQLRIWSGPYLPGKWVLESNCGKTGMVYRQYLKHLSQFLRLFVPDLKLSHEDIGAICDRHLDAAKGVLPFLGPCTCDVSQFLGMLKALFIESESINLFTAIVPSFIENLAFAMVANIEQLEAISGVPIQTIRMTGGGNRNALLMKILPLLLQDRKMTRSASTEATSRGAAIQAFLANKVFPDLESAVVRLVEPHEVVDSTSMHADRARYIAKYKEWKQRHQQIKDYLQG
jgi:autoinducer 2 (AI-2) kinase